MTKEKAQGIVETLIEIEEASGDFYLGEESTKELEGRLGEIYELAINLRRRIEAEAHYEELCATAAELLSRGEMPWAA